MMTGGKRSFKSRISENGFLLVIPALLISFFLWPFLPGGYDADNIDRGIPSWLLVLENVLRLLMIAFPFFLLIDGKKRTGFVVYALGLFLYLLSYLLQIFFPDSFLAQSLFGFSAPAWTTIVWLSGIGILCQKTWLPGRWKDGMYFPVVVLFWLVHTAHIVLAYQNTG
jgi:hypothetical protein